MAKSGSKVMLAALAGLAAGIGVGMLLAPAKGSKTRKRLKKRIMGIADMMEDDLSDRLNTFKSAFSKDKKEEIHDDEIKTGEEEDQ